MAPLTAKEVFAKMQAQPLSVKDVRKRVHAAEEAADWAGVLQWEGRMEDMMTAAQEPDGEWVAMGGTRRFDGYEDVECAKILQTFSIAHMLTMQAKMSKDQPLDLLKHMGSSVALQERRIELLGKIKWFRDMGEEMCQLSVGLNIIGRKKDAAIYLQRARDVGAAHGFFSVESQACQGLGEIAVNEGRDEEGLDLLRNSVVAARLSEGNSLKFELGALAALVCALFKVNSVDERLRIDELEPLVLRLREAAKETSKKAGQLCVEELTALLDSARLHEVLCLLCTPRWQPIHNTRPFLQAKPLASVGHRFHQ